MMKKLSETFAAFFLVVVDVVDTVVASLNIKKEKQKSSSLRKRKIIKILLLGIKLCLDFQFFLVSYFLLFFFLILSLGESLK